MRWDGASWSPVGSGLVGNTLDLAVFDEGQGPRLFAAGLFDHAGGQPAQQIARWDGAQWTPLGLGPDFTVECLAVHDEGQGQRLFAGGRFNSPGGAQALKIARWDGSSWSEVGGGLGGGNNRVRALTVYDDGHGPKLFVGGLFGTIGTLEANCLVAWDGSAWREVGERGLDNRITTLRVHDDGSGPVLFASGSFTDLGTAPLGRILRWDGQTVTPLGSGSTVPIALRGSYDAGHGAEWIVTGGGSLVAGASGSLLADDLTLSASELMILQPALLFAGTNAPNAGLGLPFGDGLRCAGGAIRRLGVRTTSMLGAAHWGPELLSQGTFAAGATARFQVWYRDPSGSPCGTGFNLTNGMAVTVTR